jgi:molecular chaperone DnaK
VFQGEREIAAQNKLLGQFNLEGILPAQRGVPQIEVSFDIDSNGIVQVSAKDKATGKEQRVSIQSSGGLSDAEIKQMINDAELNAASDKEKRELIEAKNRADGLIASTERSLAEHGDKISADDKSKIEADIEALKQAVQDDDKARIETGLKALADSSMKIGEAMYKATQSAEAAGGAGGTGGAEAAGGAGGTGGDAAGNSDGSSETVDGEYRTN